MADDGKKLSPARKQAAEKRAKKTKLKKNRSKWVKVVVASMKVLGTSFLVLALVGAIGFIWLYNTTDLPDPNADFTTNTSFIYYNDGVSKLGDFRIQNRQSLKFDQMPQSIKDAVVAAENRDFWHDRGISITGIARSSWKVVTGGDLQGGSTITQQYIKVLYLNSDRNMKRKMKELILAIKMGRQSPKKEILQGYLNTIYFGRGAYGIQAASRVYFGVDAKNLTLSQSAVLASLLNSPSALDPDKGPKAVAMLLKRYRYVLDGMFSMGKITQAEHDKFYKKLPEFPKIPVNNQMQGSNGFLLSMVKDELKQLGFDEEKISGGGLKVTTTFDKKLQEQAVAAVQQETEMAAKNAGSKQNPAKLHGALASVEVSTGAVKALYGGPNYLKSQWNWATRPRPTASTFKTFALVAGLQNGFTLNSRLRGSTFVPRGETKTVHNDGHREYGEVTLVKAMTNSINTAFVDLVGKMPGGAEKVVEVANAMGAPKGPGWDMNNRIALGAAEVSPLDMASAYATLGNDGNYVAPHVITKVVDLNGKTVYAFKAKPKSVVDTDIARITTRALKKVVEEGTGTKVKSLDRDAAGKTGTYGVKGETQAAWFIGYTKQISTAVMYVAGDQGTSSLDKYAREGREFSGGGYPAITWLEYMEKATQDQEKLSFEPPENKSEDQNEDEQRPLPTKAEPAPAPVVSPTPTKSASPIPVAPEPVVPPVAPEPVVPPVAPEPVAPTVAPEPVAPPVAPTPNSPTSKPKPTAKDHQKAKNQNNDQVANK